MTIISIAILTDDGKTINKTIGDYDFSAEPTVFKEKMASEIDFLVEMFTKHIADFSLRKVIPRIIKERFKGNKYFFKQVLEACHK